MLVEGFFTVHKEEEFEGISVEAIDAARVCMVMGKLAGQVELGPGRQSKHQFCVRMPNLLYCLRNAHPQHFLELTCEEGDTKIVLKVFEPNVNTYTPSFQLSTLDKDNDAVVLEDMGFSLYVEIDLAIFRNAVKTSKDIKAECVNLRVVAPLDGEEIQKRTIWFIIQSESDEVKSMFPFQSTTETEPNSEVRTIKASQCTNGDYVELPPWSQVRTLYNNDFSTEYLFLFVKSMERHALSLRLGQDRPLVVEYPLGCGTKDYLRFVLAPKVTGSC